MNDRKVYIGIASNSFMSLCKKHFHNCVMASELWQRIRAARKSSGLTQEELAEKCGVTRAAVGQWESENPDRRTIPRYINLRAIAGATDTPMEALEDDETDLNDEYLRKIWEPDPPPQGLVPLFPLSKNVVNEGEASDYMAELLPQLPLPPKIAQVAHLMATLPAPVQDEVLRHAEQVATHHFERMLEKLRRKPPPAKDEN